MVSKSECKLPNVWVNGTVNPFTKGYCTEQISPPDYKTLSKDCKSPRLWIPGTKSPTTKGFCATPKLYAPITPNAPPKTFKTNKVCNENEPKYVKDPTKYICNPTTGKWVVLKGNSGKLIKNLPNTAKLCDTNNAKYLKAPGKYICNPETGNWVLKSGNVGKEILKQIAGQSKPKTPKVVSPPKPKPKVASPPKPKTPKVASPPKPKPKVVFPKPAKPQGFVFPKPKLYVNEGEIVVETDKSAAQVLKKVLPTDFNKLAKTSGVNFIDAIKMSRSRLFDTRCNMNVLDIKKITNTKIGARIFYGTNNKLNENKNNVIIKLWSFNSKYKPTSEQIAMFKNFGLPIVDEDNDCLEGEWSIYTFIMPLLFSMKASPNFLIPIESGTCTYSELDKSMADKLGVSDTEITKYTITPYIKESVDSHKYLELDLYFQVVYTLAMFAHMGLRHNDCHTGNVRIVNRKTPFKLAYKLKYRTVYCKTNNIAVVYDFDRMGVNNPVKSVTKITNHCSTSKAPNCVSYYQCDSLIGGRRDLLIFSYYIFNKVPQMMKDYIYRKILAPTEWAKAHFEKYIAVDANLNINYSLSHPHDFLHTYLSDDNIIKYYTHVNTVLNDDKFIDMCLSGKTHANLNEYKVYSFYNITKEDLVKKYQELKSTTNGL